MSVEIEHQLYEKYEDNWQLMRDSIEGDDAIKKAGDKYVPMFEGQEKKQYEAYLGRPTYEGYTQRVLDGMTGLIFSKAPIVKAPKALENLFTNIDLNGSTLTDYVQELASEVESVNRVGALVDNSSDPLDNRPYATIYPTEKIRNWKHENINGVKTLVMVVLQESKDNWEDLFTNKPITIYRVLLLVNGDSGIEYQQHVYTPDEAKPDGKITYSVDIATPKMNAKPLTYIPFVSITSEKLTIEPSKPPLIDLARENIAHFKLNVDYYHALHWLGLPTPYGSGVEGKEIENFHVGSATITAFRNPQAKLDMLQMNADGLINIENEKSKLIESMVVLGSNMLQGDKKAAEAENTVAMRSAGQNATLISTADTVSRGVVKILEIMRDWQGSEGDIEYKLNTDFNNTQINPQVIEKLITGRTLREIPKSVLIHNMREGELMPEGMTDEDWIEELENEAPIVSVSVLPPKANNNDKADLEAIKKSIGAD